LAENAATRHPSQSLTPDNEAGARRRSPAVALARSCYWFSVMKLV
jgi:hypothetical protein